MEDDNTTMNPTHDRPIGYWLRVVDARISARFADAFAAEGIGRREWMLLKVLSGDVDAPGFAERLARRGKKLRSLRDRGWVAETDGTWTLTDEGRAAKERLTETVTSIRDEVSGAVSPEDFATTLASLEAIARRLGWDEENAHTGFGHRHGFGPSRGFGPHGHGGFGPYGRRHGFGGHGFGGHGFGEPGFGGHGFGGHGFGGHGFGPGFGPGHSFDPEGSSPEDADRDDRRHGHGHPGADWTPRDRYGRRGFGPDAGCGHGGHGGRGRHSAHHAEQAYERGFRAGFAAQPSDTTAA